MKISTWNVNSVRARIDSLIKYLKDAKPDILFLQEIKTEDKNFPTDIFLNLGYNSYIYGQKRYNGVAFLSKIKINNIKKYLMTDDKKNSRVITGNFRLKKKMINLINVYVPNGNPVDTEKFDYKKNWLKSFCSNLKKKYKKDSNIIISGDFNIIPDEIDVFDVKRYMNDALYKVEIRKKFREILNLGFVDAYRHINGNKIDYTYWDYFAGSWQKNYGLRIDHFLISNTLTENFESININKKPRAGNKPSDHTPVEIVIN